MEERDSPGLYHSINQQHGQFRSRAGHHHHHRNMSQSIIGTMLRQLFTSISQPRGSYAGRTVIVTGSNIGLEFEAVRHFTRLGPTKVILAVWSSETREVAKKNVEKTTGVKNLVEVRQLYMSSYKSVLGFAARAEKEVGRLDVALLNADILVLR